VPFWRVEAEAQRWPRRARPTPGARRGQAEALTGVPIAHKDIFVTDFARTGLPTTAGSRMLAGYASPFDATVVARLHEPAA
jgi:Asp-tRNA(Asn)/Glu-tRNA(Gln) amidotransferase A subunit family amidase